jgi:hypothetical protein
MEWIWVGAMLLMGYFGFVIGVQYAWSRNRIAPFIHGLCFSPRGRATYTNPHPWER